MAQEELWIRRWSEPAGKALRTQVPVIRGKSRIRRPKRQFDASTADNAVPFQLLMQLRYVCAMANGVRRQLAGFGQLTRDDE